MSAADSVFGWIIIGLASSYMVWALPFRRGVVGLTLNMGAALVGAIGLPLLAIAIGVTRSPRDKLGFLFAAIGALATLLVVHWVWMRQTRVAADRAHR